MLARAGMENSSPPISKHKLLLMTLVLFQFFHWFDPSQPYLSAFVNVHYNMTAAELQRDVFAYDIPFSFAAAVLIAVLYTTIGAQAALLLCALSSVISPILILYTSPIGVLLSQVRTKSCDVKCLFLFLFLYVYLMSVILNANLDCD